MDNDVWIETVGPTNGDPRFYSTHSWTHYPFGPNGPVEVRVKFNLSAFVRSEVQKVLANPSQT